MRARRTTAFVLVGLLCALAVGMPWGLGGASGGPALAAEVRNPDGVAVIVGNRDYAEVGDVAYARRDAEAFRRYVVDVLGFDPRNVRLVTDANFGQMRSLFGTEGRPGILSRFVEKRRDLSGGEHVSDVVVFYSGHGLPSLNPSEAGSYLVAVDANPNDPAHNGYSVEELYRVLGALPARSVSVFLDACFSGVGGDGTPLLRASPAAVTRLPENVSENTVVFAAAEGQQIAFWDDEAGHGLFTHHLLDALYGGGDEDRDGRVTAGEVHRYLAEHMWYAALDTHGREQDAVLIDGTGTGARVLAAAPADGAFPARPALAPMATSDETTVSDATDSRVAVEELDELRWTLKTSNVRSGPGTSHEKIGRLTPGTEVNVTGEVEGTNWVRIVWQGRHAYVHESLLGVENPQNAVEKKPVVEQQSANEDISSPQSAPQAPKSYQLVPLNKTMVAKQRTYMRRDPNLSAAIVGSVEANQKIDVLARTDGWYQVTKGTEIGYVTRDTLRDLQCRTVKKTRKGEPVIWDMLDGSWYTGRDGRIYEFADSSHECIRDIMREIDFACSGHVDESRIQFKTKYVGDILPSAYKCEVVSTSIDCVITPQIEYEEQVCD